MRNLPQRLFWDTDVKKIDFKKNTHYVIERILEYGDIPHIKWLQKHYSPSEIKKVLLQSRQLTPKSANFWADYYNIPKEKVRCLNKSFLATRKRFWPY